jgi:RNA polymerase sigma factor (TIGR02999 family)
MPAPDGPADGNTPSQLISLVYRELRSRAAAYMRRERQDHILQPTALVHEAYARLVESPPIRWEGKTHFLALAAVQMRRILIEYARERDSIKRGGRFHEVTLNEDVAITPTRNVDFLALHEALERLATLSPRQSQIAELRFFGGLRESELAEHFAVSERTIRQEWRFARAWLAKQLASAPRQ